VGVTNQRETAVAWDKNTGEPLRNAIVWSDVRTEELVQSLKAKPDATIVKERSGLDISSYFTGVKFKWMLENDEKIKQGVKEGSVCFGTVDSWLIYKLSGNKVHVTECTNASRTLLMNLKTLAWDDSLLAFFNIPRSVLPRLATSSEVYGTIQLNGPLDNIPIAGCLGDQQAALLGQKCFEKGDAKCTFGTGAFMLFNTGTEPITSTHGLITTVAYHLGEKEKAVYALEGSVAVAGSSLRWLRDNLRLIGSMEEVSELGE
jgi:glycerol kinase